MSSCGVSNIFLFCDSRSMERMLEQGSRASSASHRRQGSASSGSTMSPPAMPPLAINSNSSVSKFIPLATVPLASPFFLSVRVVLLPRSQWNMLEVLALFRTCGTCYCILCTCTFIHGHSLVHISCYSLLSLCACYQSGHEMNVEANPPCLLLNSVHFLSLCRILMVQNDHVEVDTVSGGEASVTTDYGYGYQPDYLDMSTGVTESDGDSPLSDEASAGMYQRSQKRSLKKLLTPVPGIKRADPVQVADDYIPEFWLILRVYQNRVDFFHHYR